MTNGGSTLDSFIQGLSLGVKRSVNDANDSKFEKHEEETKSFQPKLDECKVPRLPTKSKQKFQDEIRKKISTVDEEVK